MIEGKRRQTEYELQRFENVERPTGGQDENDSLFDFGSYESPRLRFPERLVPFRGGLLESR